MITYSSNKNLKYYIIGIGGVSTSAIAKYLHFQGAIVGGSDVCTNEYTLDLNALGVKTTTQNEDISPYDVIIYSDAIKENNLQLIQAKSLSKTCVSRGLFLAQICKNFANVISVCGCHGKTTTSAMLAHIFYCAKQKFACHIGGYDKKFSNYYIQGSDYFITEACEYNKNFLYLQSEIGVILNTDADHLECYGNAQNLQKAYQQFASQCKKIVCLYGEKFNNATTFGFDDRADFYAKNIKEIDGKYCFTAYKFGLKFGDFLLNVCGKHNVLNALSCIATADLCGLSYNEIYDGLASFNGVMRRFENIGEYNGCTCIADYAHHPNEIKATLRTAKKVARGEIYVVFQPHTYSRTKLLFNEFVNVLSGLNNLAIYKTFAAREYFDDGGSALTLSYALKKSCYTQSEQDIKCFLSNVKSDDLILFLGAGDIYYIAKNIIKNQLRCS